MIDDWWLMIDNKDKAYELYAGPTELQRDAVMQLLVEKSWSRYDLSVIRKDCSVNYVPMIDDWRLLIDNKDKAYELYAGPTELQRDAGMQLFDQEIMK